ncbi:hypothetical protein M407DRAFT_217076 [Tulasnella calospora MUT 4182]|uniref:Uncharacterized protein n=1 Tax=Tulasnella calospora MUT 4182 TaxID=1051891 RepID=A0A0C3MDL8_9AGAM|nr:hypothetical protein M407DRAFT_217076 [Tulasnella calospora MUT 4182]
MATPTTTTRTPVARRAVPGGAQGSASSPSTNSQLSAVRGGTTARSAVSPRVAAGPLSTSAKRSSIRGSPTPSVVPTSDYSKVTPESLEIALKRETEEKEALLIRIQEHEQTISAANQANGSLTFALASAETRLVELYAEQSRMEEELAAKLEIIEKLRIQVKELEKEKRETIRRYNEQTATFEAERQTFYDSEQHLRSRIQSLSQARRRSSPRRSPSIAPKELDDQDENLTAISSSQPPQNQDPNVTEDDESEPAEMTALRLELTTLSTSHTSMQSTLHLLQTQLNDLKRVNNELQEENESYNILLRERTLSGQFDILRTTAVDTPNRDDDDDEEDAPPAVEEKLLEREGRPRSTHTRSTLDVVLEHDETHGPAAALRREESPASRHSKRSRRGGPRTSSPITRGESLADLPVAGPGLDLAAELGRAENKDILEGQAESPAQINRSAPAVDYTEVQALRSEVKALKDANKALSLYASKIIDRIISQEGFEHVLAVDYDASKKDKPKVLPPAEKPTPVSKPRPKSSFFPSKTVQEERSTKPLDGTPPTMNRGTSESMFPATSSAMAVTSSAPVSSPSLAANSPATSGSIESSADKRTRRTLSMDWKGFTNLFGGGTSASPAEVRTDKLRPLTLRAGTSITGQGAPSISSPTSFARKVETIEDENDRRERERMLATMKLMGIENPSVAPPPLVKSTSNPSPIPTPPEAPTPPPSSRVPFFTRLRSSEAVPQVPAAPLTAEALERAEAESTIAALDAKEKTMTADYAKGKSASTFTELNGGRLSEGYRKKSSQKSASGGGRGRMSTDVGDDGSNHSRAGSVNTLFSAGTME